MEIPPVVISVLHCVLNNYHTSDHAMIIPTPIMPVGLGTGMLQMADAFCNPNAKIRNLTLEFNVQLL